MITLGGAARVLTKIAAYDQRTVGETDVAAWHEALNHANPEITLDDALEAIARWHATALDGRIRVAHVIEGAQAIAYRRAGRARRAQLDEQLALEAAQDDDTTDRTEERDELLARLAAKLGPGDPNVLRRQEWVEYERRQERARRAEPNPQYDPRRAADIARRNLA